MGLWAGLEVVIEDTMVSLLINEPEHLESQEFSKIKVPLAEFETMEKEERMRFLVTEVQRNLGAGRRHGVDGFEKVLEVVGLGGTVDDETKKAIRELHGLRNVIVHRDSRADRKLVEACPWLGLHPGDRVTVAIDTVRRYDTAVAQYASTLADRIIERAEEKQ